MTDSRREASRGCRTASIAPSASRSTPTIGCSTRWIPSPRAAQRRAHRVDQERPVLGVGLDHRARRLVAVLLERRRERAHRDRLGAARRGELEGADDLVAQRLAAPASPSRAVGRQPAQERLREGADGRGALRGGALADQVEQGRPGCHLMPCSGAPPARRAALRSRRAGGRRTRRRTRGSAGSRPSTARRRRRGSPRARSSGMSSPSVLSESGVGTRPIGVSRASAASSQRRKTHSSTREFSPKPGHRKLPVSSVLAEPVDVEDLRQHRALAAADLQPVAPSSRPCGSRRTAASRTGRGAACRPRRPPRRSSRRTSGRRGRRRGPSRTPRGSAARPSSGGRRTASRRPGRPWGPPSRARSPGPGRRAW